MTATTSARDDESTDGSLPLPPEPEADPATSPNPTRPAAERPLLEDGTIVTEETRGGGESGMEEDDEHCQEDEDCGDSEIISSFRCADAFANAGGVPAEVSYREYDDDALLRRDRGGSDSEPSDAESDEEPDAAEDESEDERDGDSSADEYETDEDSSVASDRSAEESDDDDGPADGSSHLPGARSASQSQHELFLPRDVPPSTQSLKYEEASDDDDDSSDEEDAAAERFRHRTYMIGSGRSGRPRMWDGCPCGVSVSSDSGSSVGSSQASKASSKGSERHSKAGGVSFSDAVTVYPIYETSAYPASVVRSLYTQREELRANKVRAKREFAYDHHDWRNATEEEEMEANEDGELVHPVHAPPAPAPQAAGNVVRTYSSALGGYAVGGVVHRAKRMRMYYP